MEEQMTINNSLNLLGAIGTGLTPLEGTVVVNYADNTVTGSLNLQAAGLLSAQTYDNLTLTQSGSNYTISGTNGLTSVAVTYTGQAPTSSTSTVTLLSTGIAAASGTGSVTSSVVCFASGTLIRTPDGDVAIETLSPGDRVITASGVERSIKWMGHATIDCRRHAKPSQVKPIRISAGSFAPGLPSQDLWVSPGHSVCVPVLDEVLVPADLLVNGSTVQQINCQEITYWHLELDSHDIILANGLPAESYLDVDNRSFFLTGEGLLDPDRSASDLSNYCRPFTIDELIIKAIRARLRTRAQALGWRLTDFQLNEVLIIADGDVYHPTVHGQTLRYVLPASIKNATLVSPTNAAAFVTDSMDRRELGIAIRSVTIDDGIGACRTVSADDDVLSLGAYGAEGPADARFRWTSNRLPLPSSLWNDCKGHFFIRFDLGHSGLPRWNAPEAGEPTQGKDSQFHAAKLNRAA